MSEMNEQVVQPAPEQTKKSNPISGGIVVLGVIVLALLLFKFISDNAIPDVPGVVLTDMHSIEDLRAQFNKDAGTPRLVLLLSPT
jgi:hypothetical protein